MTQTNLVKVVKRMEGIYTPEGLGFNIVNSVLENKRKHLDIYNADHINHFSKLELGAIIRGFDKAEDHSSRILAENEFELARLIGGITNLDFVVDAVYYLKAAGISDEEIASRIGNSAFGSLSALQNSRVISPLYPYQQFVKSIRKRIEEEHKIYLGPTKRD